VLRILIESRFSWADLLWYAIFFVIGYMMAANERFTVGIRKHTWLCLVLWILGFMGIGLLNLIFGYDPYPGKESFSILFVIFHILWSVGSLSAVLFVLGIGARFLNFNNDKLAYANDTVLPFYLFHQTIILCVGWFVIRWDMAMPLKLLIVVVVSFPLIMLYSLQDLDFFTNSRS